MLEDIEGRHIKIGDIVVFVAPGAGAALPGLAFGEVIKTTRASVKVFFLDKDKNRIQTEQMVEDRSEPPYWIGRNGKEYYKSIGTGIFHDAEPQSIKYRKDRFCIIQKP